MDYLKIAIYGTGGHAKVVEEILALKKVPIAGFLDPRPEKKGKRFCGYEILGSEELFKTSERPFDALVIAVGNPRVRIEISSKAKKYSIPLFSAIHPHAIVSPTAKIGAGTVISAGARIGPYSIIGENSIINTNASVDHDCKVGNFSHIAPGAVLCGGVSVGNISWVGAGATIIEGICIENEVMVGAGAVVIRDVPSNSLVIGVPAKIKGSWKIQ